MKLFLLLVLLSSAAYAEEGDYKPCEDKAQFGCIEWETCLPCSMVKDEDGELRKNNAPGWCWINTTSTKKYKF